MTNLETIKLGVYEKSIPLQLSWKEKFECAKNAGFDFIELSVDGLEPRINRAAPVYPFLSDYKRVWDMDLDQHAYEELRSFFRHHDPRHEREDAIFEKLGYIDIANLAPRVKSIVKMATGLMDDICPPSTQYAAYNRLTCEKSHVLYPDFGHEYLPDFDDITFQFMLEMKK